MAAEDDARRGEDKAQALTDQRVAEVDKLLAAKEAELMEI
jgi:ribosome recycling factor